MSFDGHPAKARDEDALALAMRRMQASNAFPPPRDGGDSDDGDDALMPPAPSPSVAAAAAAAAAQFPSPAAVDPAHGHAIAEPVIDETEMQKLQPVIDTVRKIKRLIASLPTWNDADIPCVRATTEKLPTACTEQGYAAIKIGLMTKTTALHAQNMKLQDALQNYSTKLNEVCRAKYNKVEYRDELRSTQDLRIDEKQVGIAVQAAEHQTKMDHTKGYAKRHAQKQTFKRKKLGTDEMKKEKTIFDL